MGVAEDAQVLCREAVLVVFPEICPDYLGRISGELSYDYQDVVERILEEEETSGSYPRRTRLKLKRKRLDDKDDADQTVQRFDNNVRRRQRKTADYIKTSRALLSQAFPKVMVKDLNAAFETSGYCLFPAFLAVDKLLDEWDHANPSLKLKKTATKGLELHYRPEALVETIGNAASDEEREVLEEFQAATAVQLARRLKREAEKRRDLDEADNFRRAKAEGAVMDCECCYTECPMNRMVHCDGEPRHWFCRDCGRRMAEAEIGLSKYHLVCMSMDGCSAGFSNDQRDLFLDPKAKFALERIEQEAVLRLAGIENLESCPFCPFAAEYPSVEVDKEFRCQNPECEEVSCRLCRKRTHIPKSCDEAERENGHSARRAIEEAMSAALIRTCNRCGTPFIKENGCNKMTCTRNGCFNIQCYVCHKSCDYTHFNDSGRGGKQGNCPLFESVEQRHDHDVRAAEEQARREVAESNPEIKADLLEIMVSEKVKADEQKRKKVDMVRHAPPPNAARLRNQAENLARLFNNPFRDHPGPPPNYHHFPSPAAPAERRYRVLPNARPPSDAHPPAAAEHRYPAPLDPSLPPELRPPFFEAGMFGPYPDGGGGMFQDQADQDAPSPPQYRQSQEESRKPQGGWDLVQPLAAQPHRQVQLAELDARAGHGPEMDDFLSWPEAFGAARGAVPNVYAPALDHPDYLFAAPPPPVRPPPMRLQRLALRHQEPLFGPPQGIHEADADVAAQGQHHVQAWHGMRSDEPASPQPPGVGDALLPDLAARISAANQPIPIEWPAPAPAYGPGFGMPADWMPIVPHLEYPMLLFGQDANDAAPEFNRYDANFFLPGYPAAVPGVQGGDQPPPAAWALSQGW